MKYLLKTLFFTLTINSILFADEKLADYFSVKYLIQDVKGYGDGKALAIETGRDMEKIPLVLSGEFTTTIDEASKNGDNISLYTVGGYVGYFFRPAKRIYIIPNIGLIYENVKTNSKKKSTFNTSYGINFNYILARRLDILYDYKVIESKIKHYGLGIRYRF